MEKNNIISDWLDQYGDSEIDKFVENKLSQNEMKQTAVEWLVNEIKNNFIIISKIASKEGYNIMINVDSIENLIEQAKQMEKDQIKEVFIDVSDVLLKETDTQQKAKIKQAAEQYYNETFKSE